MIPATLVMFLLWWWAARLRRRPSAPRLLGLVPLGLVVVLGSAWAATLWSVNRASEATRQVAPTGRHEALVAELTVARWALGVVGVVLLATLVLLVVVAVRTWGERPFKSARISGPR